MPSPPPKIAYKQNISNTMFKISLENNYAHSIDNEFV